MSIKLLKHRKVTNSLMWQ